MAEQQQPKVDVIHDDQVVITTPENITYLVQVNAGDKTLELIMPDPTATEIIQIPLDHVPAIVEALNYVIE